MEKFVGIILSSNISAVSEYHTLLKSLEAAFNFMLNEVLSLSFSSWYEPQPQTLDQWILKTWERALSHPSLALSSFLACPFTSRSLSSFITKPVARLDSASPSWTLRYDVGSISQEFNKEPARSLCSERSCNVFSGKEKRIVQSGEIGNSAAHYSCPSYSPPQ